MTGMSRMLLRSTTALSAAVVGLALAVGPALSEQGDFQDPWLETNTGIWTGDPLEQAMGTYDPGEPEAYHPAAAEDGFQDPWLETVTGIWTGDPLDPPKGDWEVQQATSGARSATQQAEIETYSLRPDEYYAGDEEPEGLDAE